MSVDDVVENCYGAALVLAHIEARAALMEGTPAQSGRCL